VDPARDGYWHLLRDFRPEGWRDKVQPGRPHDIGGLLAQVPGKPLLISEAGTFSHSDRSLTQETLWAMRTLLETAAESGCVLGVTWFIWNSGPEHAGNLIWENPDLRAGMEALPDFTTTCRLPVRGAAPTPIPQPAVTGGEVHERVVKRDGYTAVARRLLGREPTMAEVAELSAYNGNAKLVPGACVRSPWPKAVRK